MMNPKFSPNLTDEQEILEADMWEEEESRFWETESSYEPEYREPDDSMYEREEQAHYNPLDY